MHKKFLQSISCLTILKRIFQKTQERCLHKHERYLDCNILKTNFDIKYKIPT